MTMHNIQQAVRRLDYYTFVKLVEHLPETLPEQEDLLQIVDKTVAKEMTQAAKAIAASSPEDVAEIALAHSQNMQNYRYIRTLLCGNVLDIDDSIGELGFF